MLPCGPIVSKRDRILVDVPIFTNMLIRM